MESQKITDHDAENISRREHFTLENTFPGGKFSWWKFLRDPVVRAPFSHCQEPGFNPWLGNLGNYDPTSHAVQPRNTILLPTARK